MSSKINKINGVSIYDIDKISNYRSNAIISSNMDFSFATGSQYKLFQRIGTDIYVTSVAYSNVSSYNIYYSATASGETQSWSSFQIPGTMSQHSAVYISITPSFTTQSALLTLSANGIKYGLSYSSKNYYYPRTYEYKVNFKNEKDYKNYTNVAMRGETGYTFSFRQNVIFSDPVSGNFELIIPPYNPLNWQALPGGGGANEGYYIGLNDRVVPDGTPSTAKRINYSWHLTSVTFFILERDVSKDALTYRSGKVWFKIAGSVSGSTGYIKYYLGTASQITNDMDGTDAIWGLRYSSLATYSITTKFYADMVTPGGYALISPPRLKQL